MGLGAIRVAMAGEKRHPVPAQRADHAGGPVPFLMLREGRRHPGSDSMEPNAEVRAAARAKACPVNPVRLCADRPRPVTADDVLDSAGPSPGDLDPGSPNRTAPDGCDARACADFAEIEHALDCAVKDG